MDTSTRVRLLHQAREAIDDMPWDNADVLLEAFGIGGMPDGVHDFTLVQWLQENATNEQLLELGRHLGLAAIDEAGATSEATPSTPLEPDPLFIFGSHLSTERAFLGEVETHLRTYQVTLFVAHDSIAIDADWEPEIADALRRCHAGAAFLHKGLHASYYCMQEVGWLLGRGVPIARVLIDETPRGLLGSKQGIDMHGRSSTQVADAIVEYAASKSELQPHLSTSLVRALRKSTSFSQTDQLWARLKNIYELTTAQAALVLEAAELQDQVYRASVGGWSGERYRNAIAKFLESQKIAKPNPERIEALRRKSESGIPILGDDEDE